MNEPAARLASFSAPPSWRAWALALAAVIPVGGGLLALGVGDETAGLPSWPALIWFVIAAPLVEETLFRGGLQEWLLRRRADALGPLSAANGLASLAFATAHLWYHPAGWAAAAIVPALVFGWFYERGRRLWRPMLVHAVYNAVFFAVMAGP